MLYQLNYTHHMEKPNGKMARLKGLEPLTHPPELQARMERVMGIEPTRPAWKAGILPLNYTRMGADCC